MMNTEYLWLSFAMLGIVCLLALIVELDFFIALPKFGAKYFGAPDDLKEFAKTVPDKPRAEVVFGVILMVLSLLGVLGVFVWAAIDTYRNYPGFLFTFLRFFIILDGYKAFDVLCFDYLLLTKIRLPEKLYPASKGAKGYRSFGFNAKSQLIKAILFAVASLLIAALFAFICR